MVGLGRKSIAFGGLGVGLGVWIAVLTEARALIMGVLGMKASAVSAKEYSDHKEIYEIGS